MSHRCSRNFWNRREFLFRSGGGISGSFWWLASFSSRLSPLLPGTTAAERAIGIRLVAAVYEEFQASNVPLPLPLS